jgi:anti-sigma-K factor RskA
VSTQDTRPDRRDCGLDAAAYVLGALEQDELEAFRAHLSGCAACREEVAALQHVADALPAAAPAIAPPQDLRRRVMEAVRVEQKRAASTALADRRPARSHRRPPFSPQRPAAALGGALATVAAIVVAIVLASSGSSPTRVIRANVRGAGTAKLIVAAGRGELVVTHFPPPGRGRIYQVWLQRPHRAPAPTHTLFDVTTGGAGEVGVAGDLHGVSEVLVTAEPLGGSSVPTSAPVITAQL